MLWTVVRSRARYWTVELICRRCGLAVSSVLCGPS